ncbi:MAG TPA: hypothetical protein VHG93_03060, partial [Longimicrobium sp.]|nr:hypothetical protein [Longimicrobium sp.]
MAGPAAASSTVRPAARVVRRAVPAPATRATLVSRLVQVAGMAAPSIAFPYASAAVSTSCTVCLSSTVRAVAFRPRDGDRGPGPPRPRAAKQVFSPRVAVIHPPRRRGDA